MRSEFIKISQQNLTTNNNDFKYMYYEFLSIYTCLNSYVISSYLLLLMYCYELIKNDHLQNKK